MSLGVFIVNFKRNVLHRLKMEHAMHPVLTSALSATHTEVVSKHPGLTIITQVEHL